MVGETLARTQCTVEEPPARRDDIRVNPGLRSRIKEYKQNGLNFVLIEVAAVVPVVSYILQNRQLHHPPSSLVSHSLAGLRSSMQNIKTFSYIMKYISWAKVKFWKGSLVLEKRLVRFLARKPMTLWNYWEWRFCAQCLEYVLLSLARRYKLSRSWSTVTDCRVSVHKRRIF